TRPGPRTWSSRLGLRRRIRAWREKHPVAARAVSWTVTVLAAGVVYVCLLMPTTLNSLKPAEFMRLPAEAIMGAVVLMSLPRRPRIVLAAFSGVLTAVVAILNMLDMGFNEYLGRGFNVVLDWSLFADARGYLVDTLGGTITSAVTVGVILFVLLLIVLVALAVVRLSNLLAAHKAQASRGALIAGTVWITCTAFGLQISDVPLAADHTAAILKLRTVAIRNTLRDEAEFEKVAKVDAFGNTPGSQLVPDLRGKDMIFTFIESYGRSAIEDPIMAPGVDETLAADTQALSKAGFAAKSGWLTSATYGGSSWLGHSTTMSGLWVNNQQRYRTVMASDHLSLTDAFKKTGDYDTVGVMPGIQKGWPEQSFYGLDKVYNAFQLGYKGPKFSWSTMPDQYALEQFQKQVHSKPRTDGKSLMSMIILTSSHQPWAPIPKLVPWDQLGNGSIFDAIEKAGNKASDVIADTTKSRQEYGKSIQYSVNSLTQWLERYGNDNTVLVFLGDHQPIARVSGNHASRDVPISIVAKDPKVLAKIDSWNWTDGLRPAHDAPVWKMSAFRDKFLTAYGSTPHPKTN
ncbi:sulfatase-like hydrolase/transferase, partial [Streptomyces sp. MBT62]|uniref:sulfatase-like hydrolase/transferase n=1 Tax=Streptomyces sp. MBT62 TaxID=2800410 RepID=UPI0035AB877F